MIKESLLKELVSSLLKLGEVVNVWEEMIEENRKKKNDRHIVG